MANQSSPSRPKQPAQTLTIFFNGTPAELTQLADFLGSHHQNEFTRLGASLTCNAQSSLKFSTEQVRQVARSPHPEFSG